MGKIGNALTQMACGLHKREWTLYGGIENLFVYCGHCCGVWGNLETWPTVTGISYDEASVSLRMAAEESLTRSTDAEIGVLNNRDAKLELYRREALKRRPFLDV
jgi:hypothetical protein